MARIRNFLWIFFLSVSCTHQDTDAANREPDLYEPPQVVALDTTSGYITNQFSGDTIKPLVNSLADTLVSGKTFFIQGDYAHPDSFPDPDLFAISAAVDISVNSNIHRLNTAESIKEVDESTFRKVKVGEGDRNSWLINSRGDTIRTGTEVRLTGRIVKMIQPKPIPAISPAMRDQPIHDIRFLDVDQGLPTSNTTNVTTDKNGYLWISTNLSGVVRYDGKNFLHFTEANGLPSNKIFGIFADRSGNIWFATFGGGIVKFDGEKFIVFSETEGFPNNKNWCFLEDKTGKIWIGSSGGGLSSYEQGATDEEGIFTHYSTREGLPMNTIWGLKEDRKGNIWVGTYGGGAVKFDGEYFTYYGIPEGFGNGFVKAIEEDRYGNIWFGTYGGGIDVLQPPQAGNNAMISHFDASNGLMDNEIICVEMDREGNVWVGSDGEGLMLFGNFTSRDSLLSSYIHFGEREGLSNNYIWGVHEDDASNLWIASSGGGLNLFRKRSILHHSKKTGMANDYAAFVTGTKDGMILCGSDGGGAMQLDIDRKNSKLPLYARDIRLTNLKDRFPEMNLNVKVILQDSRGDIWLGTLGHGVYKFDGTKMIRYGVEHGLAGPVVSYILEDNEGNVWITSNGYGITRYAPPSQNEAGGFTRYTEKNGLPFNFVRSMTQDGAGQLWFTTGGTGVFCMKPLTKNQYAVKILSPREGLSHRLVVSCAKDGAGNVWFGTEGGGAVKFDGENFTYLGERQGLTSNIVKGICYNPPNKSFFVETAMGMNYVIPGEDENKFVVHQMGREDGLAGQDFYHNSAYVDRDGIAYFGSTKGLEIIDLNSFKLSTTVPQPKLTRLEIHETFYDYRNLNDSLSRILKFTGVARDENYPLELVLPFNQNHLTFHFIAIDWAAPAKIRYQYKLEGVDENWSAITDKTYADYRNLPYGEFTFKLRSVGEAQKWSAPFEYDFIIRAPWYHTWWARTSYAVLFVFIVYGLIRWRTAKLKQRQKELENEVSRATQTIRNQKEEVEKQKEAVELQKAQIEEAHKEITDSINYARRIQSAILPPIKKFKEFLPESFILYLPKNIVAGDFYWLESCAEASDSKGLPDSTILFAAADCTGHGVPGAMVSVVCDSGLHRAVREHNLSDPGKILDKTREIIVEEFERSEEEVKGGMDISLCALSGEAVDGERKLRWAGANNPLWIVSKNELTEFRPDKQPIGRYAAPKPFTTHEMFLEKGDMIYIFTDGYQDQFGGVKGKKFKASNLKELLISISDKPMEKQKEIIVDEFTKWKGSLEQLDDVCLIGVRV